ncbi:hypothetical protein SAMN02745751_01597 [Dethiosulfatibacter aminovorans DSM 17477]|uniref:Uncharacterized protein n=1 Tax=Dethiosulfatibacter aminovorans DSM 17477 TaxID=1121476 RepID=A0A1M6FZE6_9FIRM|nr:DUF5317 domain-containing protein [Dethiosulfatibacter aminovorans]SHJ03012.1 hypothetical protein SAMN02745751_01597 [Dethiosulfatibacter aminovorans DSM 17477]
MSHEVLITLILSMAIALAGKQYDLKKISKVKIKGLALFPASFFLQYLSMFIVERYGATTAGLLVLEHFKWIHLLSYQLLLIGVVLNIKKRYMKILFIGTMLNFIVILFNGMQMPVRIPPEYAKAWENHIYLISGKDLVHTVMTEDTRFSYLGDIIMLKKPYPFNKTISIGDIFLLLGYGKFMLEESKITIKSPGAR